MSMSGSSTYFSEEIHWQELALFLSYHLQKECYILETGILSTKNNLTAEKAGNQIILQKMAQLLYVIYAHRRWRDWCMKNVLF